MIAADATTLGALCLIGRTELISRLLGKVTIPDSVEREIRAVLEALGEGAEMPGEDVAEVAYTDMGAPTLSRPESETLEIARENSAKLVLSDDLIVREEAAKDGIKTMGTVGLLYAGHARGLIEDIEAELAKLREAGYALSPACETVLRERTGD